MSIYLGFLTLIRLCCWNTLITLDEQTQIDKECDSDDESATSNMCYMVQGDDHLEVNSDSEFDKDVDISYDKLALLCHKLLKKYNLLKKKMILF